MRKINIHIVRCHYARTIHSRTIRCSSGLDWLHIEQYSFLLQFQGQANCSYGVRNTDIQSYTLQMTILFFYGARYARLLPPTIRLVVVIIEMIDLNTV